MITGLLKNFALASIGMCFKPLFIIKSTSAPAFVRQKLILLSCLNFSFKTRYTKFSNIKPLSSLISKLLKLLIAKFLSPISLKYIFGLFTISFPGESPD